MVHIAITERRLILYELWNNLLKIMSRVSYNNYLVFSVFVPSHATRVYFSPGVALSLTPKQKQRTVFTHCD